MFGFVVVIFFILLGRLFFLVREDGERYEKRVLSQQTYVSNSIPFKRGDILDRNMTKLAVSEKVYNLILDPVAILEKKEYLEPTLKILEEEFGISKTDAQTVLSERSESRYVPMKEYKGLTEEAVAKFNKNKKGKKNIQGIWFEEEYKRVYPLKQVGSAFLGFTQKGDANIGNWGLEEYYNDELNGTDGREYGYFNSDLDLERNVKSPVNGNTIISTVDAHVQGIIESMVEEYQEKLGAKNVAVLLMNPQNGEILSMVSNQSFDLNTPRDLTAFYTDKELEEMSQEEMSAALSKLWRNYCISDSYEPGSTFKPFTIGAALEEAVISDKTSYVCNRVQVVSGEKIHCTGTHGVIDTRMAMMKSCNCALMQIGAKLGRERFFRYTDLFGFGRKTGIDLPGEATGQLVSEEKLNPVELATCSFGQSNAVTMVQMAAAFSSVVNGGNYYKPHMVKEIRNESGATLQSFGPELIKKTVSKATSEKLKSYLLDTVEEGTANPAAVAGYEIGGKTGTAEKHPRKKGNYLLSFLGCTPVENPKVVIYVVVDQPEKEKEQDHSSLATEFASKIMKKVLPFLEVYQDVEEEPKE